jgi:uncharacterized membrane protein
MDRQETVPRGRGGNELERLTLFSDAVFAIAITLLVLELKVPGHVAVAAAGGLGVALVREIPRFFAFFISFVVIGNYWALHHRMYGYLRRCDEGLVQLNLLLLLLVAFLPFPVALFGEFRRDPVAIGWYAASVALTGLVLSLIWWYATAKRRLVAPDLDRRIVRFVRFRVTVVPILFAVSVPFSFVNSKWTLFSLVVMVVPLRLFGRRLERAAKEAERAPEAAIRVADSPAPASGIGPPPVDPAAGP